MTVPAVSVSRMTVSYGATPALLDVSFEVQQGTLAGIIGPNGSGKSTLIKALLGFVKRDSGIVHIQGKRIDKASGQAAYVPQRGAVDWDFPITVKEVALMGRYKAVPWWRDPGPRDHELAQKALETVRMSEFADRQIGQLSGGQQQRVFMARAMAQGVDVFFLDEPFAGVDAATERALLDVFRSFKDEGKTLLVVHHDLATAGRYFDVLALLKRRLYAFGPPQEILVPELLAEVYEGKTMAHPSRQQSAE